MTALVGAGPFVRRARRRRRLRTLAGVLDPALLVAAVLGWSLTREAIPPLLSNAL